jgi:hypothetical protein
VRVSLAWFIDMFDSLAWSDRMEAARALEALTRERDTFALSRLRTRALGAVVEMARWKTPQHARPAFLLVGRLAGLEEENIEAAWMRGDRETVIAAANRRDR